MLFMLKALMKKKDSYYKLGRKQIAILMLFWILFVHDSYLKHYQSCCNIFGNHKKSIRNSSPCVISLERYKKVINQHPTINIIPGRKICSNCKTKIDNLKVSFQDMSSSSGSEIEEIQMQIDANQNLTNLNESLHVIEESPVKLQGLSSASQSNYGKRKLSRIHQSYESKLRILLHINILEDQANNDHFGEDKNSLNSVVNKIKSKIHNEETT